MPAQHRLNLRRTILLVLAVTLLLLRIVQRMPFVWPPGYDAWSYIGAGRALLHNQSPVGVDLGVFMPDAALAWHGNVLPVGAYLYPPLLALLHAPLAMLSFNTALTIWMGIVALSAVVLIWALQQIVGWRVALIGCLGFAPLWSSLWLGQINPLIALLLALAVVAVRREQHTRAGEWLALGALLKVTPAVSLLLLVQRRQWRSVRGAALIVASVVLFALPLTGPLDWIAGGATALRQTFDSQALVSLTAYTFRLAPGYREAATWALMLGMLAITWLRARHTPLQIALAATVLLPLLIARITWDHHMVMALPALAIMWTWSQRGRVVAASAWLALTISGGPVIPLVVTLCWVACCWPTLLTDRPTDRTQLPFERLFAGQRSA